MFALVSGSTVVELAAATFPVNPAFVWTTAVPTGAAVGWTAIETAGSWTFTAPPAPPSPTPAQQATTAMASGLAITSTSTPTLNATYPCDTTTQAKLNSMYSLIQRASGAFPGGLTSLPWPTMTGVVTFGSPAEFLAMETAVGDYVLALDIIIMTGAGALPSASVTIA